jgi:tripartite-type tricarboxylate transporter receptor subunit TctC
MRMVPALLGFCLATTLAAVPALAELNCSQVKLVVPFGAAGATDIATRVVASHLQTALGKTVLIENRAGATGNIGTIAVVNAPPDGCTLLINSTAIATFPHSFVKLGYDPFKDLVPVGGLAKTPNMFVTGPSSPAKDLRGLVALAKQRPSGLTYATSGYGLQQHLVVEEIAQRSGATFVLVPYKTAPAMLTDLAAGRVDFGSLLAGTTKSLIEERQLNGLSVIQDTRTDFLPDVRSAAEEGFPGLAGSVHFMVFAPAATPKPVLAFLQAQLAKVMSDPALKTPLLRIGYEPTPMTSEEVTAEMRKTGAAFEPLIKKLKIQLE